MNWPLIAAGSLSLMGSAIHGVVGDRIVRRIDEASLPGNPFQGVSTMLLIRVTWHFVTIAFLVLGVALLVVGAKPEVTATSGVAYVAGAAFACWSVFALVAGFRRGGIRVFKSHPGPIAFVVTVVLISWGAAQL
ncbi:MAG: hypothetical protein M3285_11850 [Actinomycetota bacterium]|nr:hypothetical protein [Actinomycetota bacterium]